MLPLKWHQSTESLQYINLCNCNFHDFAMITITTSLSSIETLKTFIISNNKISNVSANCVAAIITSNTSLEHIDFSNCMLQEVGRSMIKLALFKKLTTVKYVKL